MANITKKVDRGIPSGERSQSFTNVGIVANDVIKVADSLGLSLIHI